MKNRKESGFTIIEVMIVLAIAGLILVVVLIAVPQLQRNQRNEARRATLARISTEISNFAGNNNGKVPTSADLDGFVQRYLSDINIEDPSSGENYKIEIPNPPPPVDSVPPAEDIGTAYYITNKACDGEKIIAGTTRSYALWSQLEGGAIYCLDNL